MSNTKMLLENTSYKNGYSDARDVIAWNDDKLLAIGIALDDIIANTKRDSAYTYGFLDAISEALDILIYEAKTETITNYIKEEQNGSGEDDSGSEGDTLSGDRDDNGEAGGAEEDCTERDGSDQDSPEAN